MTGPSFGHFYGDFLHTGKLLLREHGRACTVITKVHSLLGLGLSILDLYGRHVTKTAVGDDTLTARVPKVNARTKIMAIRTSLDVCGGRGSSGAKRIEL